MRTADGYRPYRIISGLVPLLVRLAVPLLILIGLPLQTPAYADDKSESASAAVDIFVAAGNLAGLPIDKTEVGIIKELVTCAVNSTSGGDCAKNIIVSTVLNQVGASDPKLVAVVKPAAQCLVTGGALPDCVGKAVIAQLPKEAQALATCAIGGGNIGDCTAKAALAQILPQVQGALPAEALDTVNCVVGGSKLATCAQKLISKEVNEALKAAGTPPDVIATVNTMVNCVSDGRNAVDCAKSAATQNLPADVKGLATCLDSGASAQSCLADFAGSKISDPTAAAMVKCMGKSGDQAQTCMTSLGEKALGGVAEQAKQEAVKQALATIARLNVDAAATDPRAFPQTPAVLANFTLVAEGIQSGDWSKIVLGGGAQIAQIASRIILSIFLTPAVANLIGPVADMMIQNYVTGFQEAWAAARRGDPVGLSQAVFKWYETTFITPSCGLMPNGEFKNTVCGAANDAINWIAETGGDLTKDILGVGKDILKFLGLWNTVDDIATDTWKRVTSVVNDIGEFLGLGSGNKSKTVYVCVAQPKDYFANQVMSSCLASATSRTIAGGSADTSAVVAACEGYYNQCSSDKNIVHNNCQKMADALGTAANAASDTVKNAAKAFTNAGAVLYAGKIYDENRKMGVDPGPRDMCSKDFWTNMQQSYASYCAGQIGKFFPESFRSRAATSCPIPTSMGAVAQACMSALRANTAKSTWAGPDSAYCKRQKEADALEAALNPCDVSGRKTVDAGGKTIILVEPKCEPAFGGFRQVKEGPSGEIVRIPFRPSSEIVVGGLILRDPPTKLISFPYQRPGRLPGAEDGGLRLPPIVFRNPGDRSFRLPPSATRRPVGGGGPSTVRLDDATRSRIKIDREPPRVMVPARPVVNNSGPGTGGPSYSRPGGSAMDRLGGINTGAGISGVAGNSGGVSLQRPPMRPPVATLPPSVKPPAGGSAAAKQPPGQGSGGAYYVDGKSGNAPTTSSPSASSRPPAASSRPPPNRPAPKSSSPDPLIDYGGCSSCNKPPPPLVVR